MNFEQATAILGKCRHDYPRAFSTIEERVSAHATKKVAEHHRKNQ
jgi:hypothetical protein